ncbi:vacuolar ATPase assembly integral membrane protein VMA21 isoform X1 [Desmodus rotundus]|uniref:vacuolar ATPase assembly integral membrane protein VMA21 isoform X1 n=1 Tax=Desmodus rotundus TaxID=9430 RepID=UPI002381255B|nr:vacuolar ATPase assembly integral membrane protein VMA21 isoform X1 [Desmodus rotundus]
MRHLLKGWGITGKLFLCRCRRKLLGCLAPHRSSCSSSLPAPLLLSPGNRSFATGAGTPDRRCSLALRGRQQQCCLSGRTMLRGKSRLNVEWLGYSPGLLLDYKPPPAGRTPRSAGRNESSLASTLKTLLFFTALMITVPIGLYFTTKSYVFEGAFGMSNRDSYFYAAIVAVVAVHVVLALFVYVAWNEGSRQWREGKQD